jgi:hypothetical protein
MVRDFGLARSQRVFRKPLTQHRNLQDHPDDWFILGVKAVNQIRKLNFFFRSSIQVPYPQFIDIQYFYYQQFSGVFEFDQVLPKAFNRTTEEKYTGKQSAFHRKIFSKAKDFI